MAVEEVLNDAPLGRKRKLKTKHSQEDVPSKRVVSTEVADAVPLDVEDAIVQAEQQGPTATATTITSSSGVDEGESSQVAELPADATAPVQLDSTLPAMQHAAADATQENGNVCFPHSPTDMPAYESRNYYYFRVMFRSDASTCLCLSQRPHTLAAA